MVFGRILGSKREVRYGDGGVLEIRPAERGAETNGKGEVSRIRFDFHQSARGNGNGGDGVRYDCHEERETK